MGHWQYYPSLGEEIYVPDDGELIRIYQWDDEDNLIEDLIVPGLVLFETGSEWDNHRAYKILVNGRIKKIHDWRIGPIESN